MADYDSSLPIRTEAAGDVDIFLSDATVPAQKLQINADGSAEVNQKKLDSATDSVKVFLNDELGDPYSPSNPLSVEFFENNMEAFDHSRGVAIAKNATHTHTLAAPAGFKLKDVYVSGSGKMRAELKIGLDIVAVGFNSTSNPQVSWNFQKGLNASSVNVEVVIENLDNQAQDLYSTIVGIS